MTQTHSTEEVSQSISAVIVIVGVSKEKYRVEHTYNALSYCLDEFQYNTAFTIQYCTCTYQLQTDRQAVARLAQWRYHDEVYAGYVGVCQHVH